MTSEQEEVKGQQVKENNQQQAPQQQPEGETPKPVEDKKILCKKLNHFYFYGISLN